MDHICGQNRSYQKRIPDAFKVSLQSINDPYVDGISITLGSPRQHVWTYAATGSDGLNSGNCPCAPVPGASPPIFVNNNYYCESGTSGAPQSPSFYLSDPLWNGLGCPENSGCCASLGMPWFYRKAPTRLSEDIEVCICKNSPYSDEDTAIEELDIFVL